MLEIKDILANYDEKWQTPLEDRFGRRLAQFLTDEQSKQIGWKKPDSYEVKAWTEQNVLAQLKDDVEFGWEKACNERGISASMMVDVVQKWCLVLGNGLKYADDYTDYGKAFLHEVDSYYGWHLTDEDVADEGYQKKMMKKGFNAICMKGNKK